MLKHDEGKKGSNCKIEWHIEIKMHMGKGNFCCSTLNLCCKTITRMGARNIKKGCPQVGQNERNKVKSWDRLKRNNYSILLHQSLSS
jgi:hypothetical protein